MANKIIGIMKYSRAARLSKPNEKTAPCYAPCRCSKSKVMGQGSDSVGDIANCDAPEPEQK